MRLLLRIVVRFLLNISSAYLFNFLGSLLYIYLKFFLYRICYFNYFRIVRMYFDQNCVKRENKTLWTMLCFLQLEFLPLGSLQPLQKMVGIIRDFW